jgi:hypothetical protein
MYEEIVEAVGEQEAERLIICEFGTIEFVHQHLVSLGTIETVCE